MLYCIYISHILNGFLIADYSGAEYRRAFDRSANLSEAEEFWAEVAENTVWTRKWDRVLEWDGKSPNVKWYGIHQGLK